jgi:glutaredoxin
MRLGTARADGAAAAWTGGRSGRRRGTLGWMRVELVTRRGCHLCEDARRLLQELGVDALSRDVDSDAELGRLYDFRVPVVLVEGRVVAEGRWDRRELAERLRRHGVRTRHGSGGRPLRRGNPL